MLGCALWAAAARGLPADAGSRLNVILISVDTLRADRLGSYGYGRPTSPAIDRLAARGVRFAHAIAESSWTLPSHMTLMTGLLPSRHGVLDPATKLSEQVPLLAQVLRNAGYRTAGFTADGFVGSAWGFDRGFETYEDRETSPLESVLAKARARIAAFDSGERYFLFLHTYDVHAPYDPPERYGRMFETRPKRDHIDPRLSTEQIRKRFKLSAGQVRFLSDQYDAEIRAADDRLGEFFTWFERRGGFADAIVILLSDHGEEFGEHGGIGHGLGLYIEMLRVPLVIVAPGFAPGVVQSPAGLADVMPTLLELLGIPAPVAQGKSLVPTMRRPAAMPTEARALFSELNQRRLRVRSVVEGRYHLILDAIGSKLALFDLEKDPSEQSPVNLPAERDRLAKVLAAHGEGRSLREATTQPTISPAVAERLRALGYESPDASSGPSAGQDPMAAARAGDLAAPAAGLSSDGADVDGKGAGGQTALIAAAESGRADMVELLLRRGASIDAVDDRGASALFHAADEGREEIVKILLSRGAAKEAVGPTPLLAAAARGHTRTVALLLDAGADLKARNWTGARAVQLAAAGGHTDTLALLLSRGGDPNATDHRGVTPLIAAAGNGHAEAVKILLAGGAPANAKSSDGHDALLSAARNGDSLTLSLLLEHGADVGARTEDGATALMEAAEAEKSEAVRLLLNAGADVNAARPDGSTPLLAAVANEAVEVVRILLEHGADANAKQDGTAALHMAVEDDNEKLVELLLAHGADPAMPDESGDTPLDHADEDESTRIVQMLNDAIAAKRPR